MSIHPSLRQSTGKTGALRNVLKRHERLRDLLAQNRFTEGASIYGLPKTKQIRLKVRKAAKEAAPGTEGAKAAEGATPAPAAAAGKAAPLPASRGSAQAGAAGAAQAGAKAPAGLPASRGSAQAGGKSAGKAS